MNIPLFQWVNENNPPQGSQWFPGFWNYIEFIYKLRETYPKADFTVVGTYVWETMEPVERLLFPVFCMTTSKTIVTAKNTMFLEPYYVVSITSETPIESTFGLTSDYTESRMHPFEGIPDDLRFGRFTKDSTQFTALVDDDFDLFSLIRILTYEKRAEQDAAANP